MSKSMREEITIGALRRLEKTWPDTLWLYAAAGQLHLIKRGPDGRRVLLPAGAPDPGHTIASFKIPCAGSDGGQP